MLSLACCVGRRTLEFMRTISVSRFMHHAMPDIVLFNLGTNDAIAGDQPARSAVNIRKVVTEMHQVNPSVTILLSTLIPNYATDGSMRYVCLLGAWFWGKRHGRSLANAKCFPVFTHQVWCKAGIQVGWVPKRIQRYSRTVHVCTVYVKGRPWRN